jgi:hypothetical protein
LKELLIYVLQGCLFIQLEGCVQSVQIKAKYGYTLARLLKLHRCRAIGDATRSAAFGPA